MYKSIVYYRDSKKKEFFPFFSAAGEDKDDLIFDADSEAHKILRIGNHGNKRVYKESYYQIFEDKNLIQESDHFVNVANC